MRSLLIHGVLRLLLCAACMGPPILCATRYSGSVRAADQFIPGATVTASQGNTKAVAYTDDAGRYSLDLAPGVWEIQVEMLGFDTVHEQVNVGSEPGFKDWTLEMPRLGESNAPKKGAAANPTASAAPPTAQRAHSGPPRNGPARNAAGGSGPQPGPGFQNAQVKATDAGQQSLAEAAANAASADTAAANLGGEADDALLVNGSTSGGLAQSSDDQARRQRMEGGGGNGGAPMGNGLGGAALGTPPGMSAPGLERAASTEDSDPAPAVVRGPVAEDLEDAAEVVAAAADSAVAGDVVAEQATRTIAAARTMGSTPASAIGAATSPHTRVRSSCGWRIPPSTRLLFRSMARLSQSLLTRWVVWA
jgi:hypothetical protein